MLVKQLALIATLALGLVGCGSDEPQVTAADVEQQLEAEVAPGGALDLDGTAPKSITCEKRGGPTPWRCLIAPAGGGEDVVCLVAVDETTGRVTKRTCGSLDN